MPLLVLGVLIGLALFALYRVYSSSSGHRIFTGDTYIVIDDGTLRVRQGWIPPGIIAALADVLRDAGVSSGRSTVSKDNRVTISWHVPPALHQTIRNVLLLHK